MATADNETTNVNMAENSGTLVNTPAALHTDQASPQQNPRVWTRVSGTHLSDVVERDEPEGDRVVLL
jgi:hypothetical protein